MTALLTISVLSSLGTEAFQLQNASVHAAVEMLGAVSAIFFSLFLLSQCNQGIREVHLYPIALGFMALGILDGFHSLANDALPGFVWLRSLAAFFGGLFPSLVWLGWNQQMQRIALHRAVALGACALGVFFMLYPDVLPALNDSGEFIKPLSYINVMGGLLSFATSIYFIVRNKHSANAENLVFSGLYLVLGCSSVIFPFSTLWSDGWWLWHLLRLLAYGFTIRYMFASHIELLKAMRAEIFARTRVETALRESEQQFRVLVQHAPEAIVVFDLGLNRFIDANINAEHLFGLDREALLRHSLVDFYPPAQPNTMQPGESTRERINQALAGEPRVFERLIRNAQGQDILCEVRLVKLPAIDRDLVRGSFIDITERKAAEKQIEFMAYHDALTSLPNRLLAKDHFELAMSFADREKVKVALIFLDLDNFKTINDSLGHPVGDALLKAAAARLRECARITDTLSRQGGDEFLVVLSDVRDPDTITDISEKILGRMSESFDIAGLELHTSISLGIAVYPDDGKDFETLLKKADTAMYQAKGAGRNAYRFHTEKMNIDAIEHLEIRNSLKKALEHGEFALYYQPQINLTNMAVTGVEALIRWNHPEFGLVLPGRFIPIAEDSGLIVPIGEWVLKEVCLQAVAWRKLGLPELVVAVNLSAVQFRRGDLEKSVTQALGESGLDPRLLELEMTESILIQEAENILATVNRLKSLGVKLSIDDFGTGYSSLAYLKRFNVDKLKIDQSFVRDMVDNPNDAAIVRAIIQMAHSLNLRTLAEGVEDEHMVAPLRLLHCDEVQGYFFAHPMPADEFPRYLAGRQLAPTGSI
ncbi:MAG TPA: EAL domain-containing protein [Sulfuriferula sp.]|nr:EAL domain-containing protein [Sulfuriferula sp.]